VAHAYNPSYSGGRDQEDRGLKPAWANSSRDPILKNPSQKRAGRVAQGVGLEFKRQYCQTQKGFRTRTGYSGNMPAIAATQEADWTDCSSSLALGKSEILSEE
jgi:hypothetical protein